MWKTVLELEPGFTSAHWGSIPVALLLPLDYSLLLLSAVCTVVQLCNIGTFCFKT